MFKKTEKNKKTATMPRPDPRQGAVEGQKALRPRIFIATGASGGHIFPGLAIANVLRREGYWCTFVGSAKQFSVHIKEQGFDLIPLPAKQFNVSGVWPKIQSLKTVVQAYLKALKLMRVHKPVAVLGMGSYASVATVLAAKTVGIPTLIHEQNPRPGRANRLLARFVDKVLLAFDEARLHLPHGKTKPKKFQVVGNPIRQEVLAYRGLERESGKALNLLVFGGSQGAKILTDIVPQALDKLSKNLRQRISVTQQARPEEVEQLTATYKNMEMGDFKVQHFFNDLPELMHRAHVVVSRAGIGTISELAVLNRASILVPLRLADGHQRYNAQILSKINAATLIEEEGLTPASLALELESLLTREGKRTMYEKNTALVAKPHAAQESAQEVIRLCGLNPPNEPPSQEDVEEDLIEDDETSTSQVG